jgi:hypothetical protein
VQRRRGDLCGHFFLLGFGPTRAVTGDTDTRDTITQMAKLRSEKAKVRLPELRCVEHRRPDGEDA